MRIILKHILKNIWEKKGRSLLIIISLIIATTVFVLNLTMPNELILKIQETLRSIYGETDIGIATVEPFSINDVIIGNEKITYVGVSELDITIDDKQAIVFGLDIDKSKDMKMLGDDIPNLNKNEVVINQKHADEHGYKVGDLIKFTIEEQNYELKIVKIVSKKGLTSLDIEYPIFVANLETVNAIRNIETEKYDTLYIDVENDENAKSFAEYLKENNDNYIVEELASIESIKEQTSFVTYILIMVFAMATIMIFFVVSSLNNVIIAERMPVIGTFRSIGATKGKMNLILILENAVYGLIGGLIGVFAGYGINSKVASLFITTNGVELTNKTSQMTIGTMLIGIAFAVILEILISIRAIIKANKKQIKDIIFDVQSTRYAIKRISVILGILLVGLSFILNYTNKDIKLVPTLLSIVFLIVGVANLVPIIIRIIALILAKISKKIGWATGVIACKNIGYNKMIISSSRLIVVAISIILAILTVSVSYTELFTSFKYTVDDCDIVIENVTKTAEEYNKLLEIENVKKIHYMYCYWDTDTTYNDGEKFNIVPTIVGQKESRKYIKELDYKIEDLKENEIVIDEKYAERNNLKVNDVIKIKWGTLNKELELKIVGLINSAYFSTNRNVIVMNLESYIENIKDVPMQVNIETKEGTDLQGLKEKIENNVKEIGIKISTVDEYLETQKEQVDGIMSIFYIIIGLAVILSFIGIINNQIICFIQRRKELAILNSTCMSKKQLKKMLRIETILSNAISCLIAVVVGFMTTGILETFLETLSMYVEMIFDWNMAFKFIGIVFVLLLCTLIIPSRRMKKMNIVNEIKYE